jgi:chitin disaccharide deacetylase
MATKKHLIVNADDFGHSTGVNRGIIQAHEYGIVTSASVLVLRSAAVKAAEYGRRRPSLSLGLHIDLGEWVYRNESWIPLYRLVDLDGIAEVKKEISRQLDIFRNLIGKDPTHIDSHQHVHLREPARSIVLEIAEDLKVPVRDCNSAIRYCGGFYGQTREGLPYPEGISADRLIELLAQLQPGVTELGCHPGAGGDLDTTYDRERPQEVKALCEARVRTALIEMGIELGSFSTIPRFRTTNDREPVMI